MTKASKPASVMSTLLGPRTEAAGTQDYHVHGPPTSAHEDLVAVDIADPASRVAHEKLDTGGEAEPVSPPVANGPSNAQGEVGHVEAPHDSPAHGLRRGSPAASEEATSPEEEAELIVPSNLATSTAADTPGPTAQAIHVATPPSEPTPTPREAARRLANFTAEVQHKSPGSRSSQQEAGALRPNIWITS